MIDFNDDEARILNCIQDSFPLVQRPFAAIGNSLDLLENDVITIISNLKKRRIIRNIAAIFNPRRLGYAMGLVAMAIPDGKIKQAASIINEHPGVSHNYLRNHFYNMWFTLAEESENRFSSSVKLLAHRVGASDVLVLETEQILKIGVKLEIGRKAIKNTFDSKPIHHNTPGSDNGKLSNDEKKGIVLLQNDIPMVEEPFSYLNSKYKYWPNEDRFLEIAASLQQKGVMRRYAAVLYHMKAGFTHNALTVWKLPGNNIFTLEPFIRETAVSHLYKRTTYPNKWEYPLFAMIHAKNLSALSTVVQKLSWESGITDYKVLHSLQELKKQRVVYFSDQFKQWRMQFKN